MLFQNTLDIKIFNYINKYILYLTEFSCFTFTFLKTKYDLVAVYRTNYFFHINCNNNYYPRINLCPYTYVMKPTKSLSISFSIILDKRVHISQQRQTRTILTLQVISITSLE